MLSDDEAREMEAWLRSARRWSESAQSMVGATTELTNSSRTLATQLAERPPGPRSADGIDAGMELAPQLRLLAETIEGEGRELRDRFLATEANLELYASLLG